MRARFKYPKSEPELTKTADLRHGVQAKCGALARCTRLAQPLVKRRARFAAVVVRAWMILVRAVCRTKVVAAVARYLHSKREFTPTLRTTVSLDGCGARLALYFCFCFCFCLCLCRVCVVCVVCGVGAVSALELARTRRHGCTSTNAGGECVFVSYATFKIMTHVYASCTRVNTNAPRVTQHCSYPPSHLATYP